MKENETIKNKSPDSPSERKSLTKKNSKKNRNNRKNKNKIKIILNKRYIIISSFFIIIIVMVFVLFYILLKNQNTNVLFEKSKNPLIFNTPEKEYKNCQEYMNMIKSGQLYDKEKIFYPTNNPKISIVLPVHNGEGFVKETLLSIQNQDFKDIEIIIIDDHSTDNSVNLIKELMKNEPRISLFQQEENKGALYTKTRGVLSAKGKYVMIINDDDKYLQRDAFTTLFAEAEKNDLDIIRFRIIQSTMFSVKGMYNNELKSEMPTIFQPELSNFMYFKRSDGNIMQNGGTLYNHIFRTDLFKKIINEIDKKYLNTMMNDNEDFLLFFLLSRNAKNLKQIDRIFYMIVVTKFNHEPKVEYRRKEKNKDRGYLRCQSYLNFVEIIFDKTKDTFEDKKIPFSQFKNYYLNNECVNSKAIREKGVKLCNLFLDCKFISDRDKSEIKNFLFKMKEK